MKGEQAGRRTVPEACLHRQILDTETWIPDEYLIGIFVVSVLKILNVEKFYNVTCVFQCN